MSFASGFAGGVTFVLTGGNFIAAGMVAGAVSGAMTGRGENVLGGAAIGGATGALGGFVAWNFGAVGMYTMMAAGAGVAYAQGGLDGLAYYGAGVLGAYAGAFAGQQVVKAMTGVVQSGQGTAGTQNGGGGTVGEGNGYTTWPRGEVEAPTIEPGTKAEMAEALKTHKATPNSKEPCFAADRIDGRQVSRPGTPLTERSCKSPIDFYETEFTWHVHKGTAVPSYQDQTSFRPGHAGPEVIYGSDGITVMDPRVQRWNFIERFQN